MSTLKQVINKSTEVKTVDENIDELQAKKAALQSQLGTINSSLDERRATRDALVLELRALIAALP